MTNLIIQMKMGSKRLMELSFNIQDTPTTHTYTHTVIVIITFGVNCKITYTM